MYACMIGVELSLRFGQSVAHIMKSITFGPCAPSSLPLMLSGGRSSLRTRPSLSRSDEEATKGPFSLSDPQPEQPSLHRSVATSWKWKEGPPVVQSLISRFLRDGLVDGGPRGTAAAEGRCHPPPGEGHRGEGGSDPAVEQSTGQVQERPAADEDSVRQSRAARWTEEVAEGLGNIR